jgi:NADH-quinone oxidoreductase subunit J
MQDALFYLFGALAVLCAFLVVANPFTRSPVTSAMFLVLTIIALAGLFVLLHAYFLAAVQVLVYAGAVMVLFLFVIMLLDLKEEARRRYRVASLGAAVVVVGSLAFVFIRAIWTSGLTRETTLPSVRGETNPLGHLLFTEYLLPFEIVSVLLLVAMIGVVLLSKKQLK